LWSIDSLKAFVDEQVSQRGYGTSSEFVREQARRDIEEAVAHCLAEDSGAARSPLGFIPRGEGTQPHRPPSGYRVTALRPEAEAAWPAARAWAATIILAGGTTIMMAGGEESKAA
jgi:antitoxin ParD1/3/4